MLGRAAGSDCALHHTVRLVSILHALRQHQHFGPERVRHVHQVVRPLSAQGENRLFNFEGIAAGATQRTVHRGDQRDDRAVVIRPKIDHRLRELQPTLDVRKECARPALHVKHESSEPLRELLAHDARRNERNRLHGAGRIAQRVHLPVGRSDF